MTLHHSEFCDGINHYDKGSGNKISKCNCHGDAVEDLYGIWSRVSKKFVFGIAEPSKTKARKKLFDNIGSDSYKYRFEVRRIKPHLLEQVKKKPDRKPDKQINKELEQLAKEKKANEDLLKRATQYIIDRLKAKNIIIQRYNSYSSNSIYLKFDYGVCNSLRISDHQGKKYLAYRYNLLSDITQLYTDKTPQGWERHYAPMAGIDILIDKIIFDRDRKLEQYGIDNYLRMMEKNKNQNTDSLGFWSKAVLV